MPGVTTAYQTGDHASRPAASAGCILYSCTTHGLVYRSDGSSWSTWLTLATGDITAHLADSADAHDASAISIVDAGGHFSGSDVEAALQELGAGGGGGGGGGWDAAIDEDGSDFSNFTANNGTWSSTGTVIQQTATTGTVHTRARHNTLIALGLPLVAEAEILFPTSGQGTAQIAGLNIGYNGSNGTGSIAVQLARAAGQAQLEHQGIALIKAYTVALSLDTWYTLRGMISGPFVTISVDGTILGSHRWTSTASDPAYVGLLTYEAHAQFRNVKFYTATAPA